MTKTEIWKEIERLKAIAEFQNFFSRIGYKYEWELGADVYGIISNELHIYINERSSERIELIGFPVRINYEDKTIIKLWKEVEQ